MQGGINEDMGGRPTPDNNSNLSVTENENFTRGNSTNINENKNKTPSKQKKIRGKKKRNKGKRFLKCITTNAQSLKNKMGEFMKLVEIHKPKVISITESWGKEWINDGIFSLKGYSMYRDDREGKEGGGTILYISNKLEHRGCRPLNTHDFESSTWCWIIEKGGKKILVGSVYRSTSSTAFNNRQLLEKILKANDISGDNRLLLLGDFNVPKIDWTDKNLLRGAERIEAQLLDVVNDCFLYQHVREATRFRNEESSILDLIFTKEEEDVRNIKVLQPLGKSDHGVVIADFVCEWKSKIEQKPRRMYHKGNYEKILEGLNEINWETEFTNKTVQECWDIFKMKLESLSVEHIPMSSPKDYNEPWMNGKLMKLWRSKYFAWKRYTETKGYQRYMEYKKETNLLKKQTRVAKRLYEKKIAKEVRHNKRQFYRYVNSKLTVRPEISEMQNELGELVDSDKEICNILARYFNSVYTPASNEEMPEMNEIYENEISNINISRNDIQTRLEKLNVNKSCGPDNIHPFVLQKTAIETSKPLEIIFRKSLEFGECPSDWRSANVTPIHKKGDRTDPSNYRPVSLTSQVCKVLESIVRKQLLEHLTENNILRDEQHGFREGRSCLTNLLGIMEDWTKIIDEGDGIDVAYLDFRKAFDLVSHKHLLYKMSKYGIKHQVLKWVQSFLQQRTQRVVVRGEKSEPCNVTSGVPQGSVLGPILFLIFINDLPLGVISPVSLFADDSKVFSRIISEKNSLKRKKSGNYFKGNEVLQNDLNSIREWARRWKMEFNVDKCKIMHMGRSNPQHTYSMDGAELTKSVKEKDLGVLVENNLEFDQHIKGIVGRANRLLGLIKIGFACLDQEVFMNLYPVLVRPLLEYCVQVWSPYKRKHINLIERVQRRATKLVPALRDLSYEERLSRLKLTTLEERRTRGDMILTYKLISRKEGISPDKFFTMANVRGDPEIACGKKIYRKRSNLDKRKHCFSQRVPIKWNNLSKKEVEASSTSVFKKEYDLAEPSRTGTRHTSNRS